MSNLRCPRSRRRPYGWLTCKPGVCISTLGPGMLHFCFISKVARAILGSHYQQHRARGRKANTTITIVARRMTKILRHLLKERR
jgi:thiamine pyrophosphate-dependent acetolactate synthase large subunit-like protein